MERLHILDGYGYIFRAYYALVNQRGRANVRLSTAGGMRVATIAGREVAGFFAAPVAYVVGVLFLVAQGFSFWAVVGVLADPRRPAPLGAVLRTFFGGTFLYWSVLFAVLAAASMPKVVIAVVPGWAVGGGHSLHVVCDLTLASKEHAIFKQTDPDVASFDSGYGSALLARQVGQKFAREVFFLGDNYSADEAFAMRVHPDHAIALGAALVAAAAHGGSSLALTDILPASIQLDVGERSGVILRRGAKLPARTKFEIEAQVGVDAEFTATLYRGEEAQITDNELLGTVRLPSSLSEAIEGTTATVVVDVSADGLLTLAIRHPVTGEIKSLQLSVSETGEATDDVDDIDDFEITVSV